MARISIFLTNLGRYVEGCLVGQWVKLPIDESKLQEVLTKIGINEQYEEYFITDYESEFSGLEISEYASISKLNELAKRLDSLADCDCDKLDAVLEYESTSSVMDILDLIENLDNFDLLEDVNTDEDLGYYYAEMCGTLSLIPEHLQSYFDYESYGRDIRLESSCLLTSYGLVMDNR